MERVPESKLKRIKPMEVYARHWYYHAIRELGAERIQKSYPNLVIYYEDDDSYEFDWDMIIFKLSSFQLKEIVDRYIHLLKKWNKEVEDKLKEQQVNQKSSLILPNQKHIISPNGKLN